MFKLIFFFLILVTGFNINIMYINEEFLLFLTLSIFFFLIYKNFHKSINLFFFLRIEFIFLTFLYLIKSNKYLSRNLYQILKLVKLRFKKLDFIIIKLLYRFSDINLKLISILGLNMLFIIQFLFSHIIEDNIYKLKNINFFNLYWNGLSKFLLKYE